PCQLIPADSFPSFLFSATYQKTSQTATPVPRKRRLKGRNWIGSMRQASCRGQWPLGIEAVSQQWRRTNMKLNAGRAVLSTSLLVAFATFAPSARATQCSLAGTAGKYGFTLTGVVILPTGPVPIAAVGRATLDAAGNASGTESRNVGG